MERDRLLEFFQDRIGYHFEDSAKLHHALTHSSFCNETANDAMHSNERLEFLGDAVLSLCSSEILIDQHPDWNEGHLSQTRAATVCEPVLAQCARQLELDKLMKFGKGAVLSGARAQESILADACEALLAAIYMDGGYDKAKAFVLRHIFSLVKSGTVVVRDYKSELNELMQKRGDAGLAYRLVEQKGPVHNREFVMEVSTGGHTLGQGSGQSKKHAQQQAAKVALEALTAQKSEKG